MGNPVDAGVGILLNATTSSVTSVTITSATGAPPPTPVPGWTLPAASSPSGAASLNSCTFSIPSASTFDVQVGFDTGQLVTGTVNNPGTAATAIVVVVFLNLLVPVTPSGRARQIMAKLAAASLTLPGKDTT